MGNYRFVLCSVVLIRWVMRLDVELCVFIFMECSGCDCSTR